jgi:hypothetical protein
MVKTIKFDLQRFADTSIEGLSAQGTVLSYAAQGATTFTAVAGVKTVPAIGGSPQTIDVTALDDDSKKSVAGLQSVSNLAFTTVYKTTNFSDLISKADGKTIYDWKVTYPDGMTATFSGSFTLATAQAAVNGSIDFTITVVVSDGPDFAAAPSTGTSGS